MAAGSTAGHVALQAKPSSSNSFTLAAGAPAQTARHAAPTSCDLQESDESVRASSAMFS